MWKTLVFLRDTITFFPQVTVNKKIVFHRAEGSGERQNLSTENFSTFHSLCGENYRQELILAVMSRMLFCNVVSPCFSAISTLRIAYKAVV